MYGEQAHFFEDEIRPHLRHKKKGMVAMAGEDVCFIARLVCFPLRQRCPVHQWTHLRSMMPMQVLARTGMRLSST